jgi:hypothetical protein
MSTKECIQIDYLRENKYTDLEDWLKNENNIYVGRFLRIFIWEKGVKRIFITKASKWGNPYKPTDKLPLKEVLILYVKYLFNTNLIYDIGELKEKNLGCFCKTKDCHAQVLVDIINKCYKFLEPDIIKRKGIEDKNRREEKRREDDKFFVK